MSRTTVARDTADEVVAAWRRELPAVAGIELELSKRAARLSALFTEATASQLTRLGLTKAEYEVLAVLRASGKPYRLRPTDLAARLLLSSGGLSNLLRRLGEAGLVTRQTDNRDARTSWVQLTEAGVGTAETAVRASGQAQAALLRSVPAAEARAAADALRTVLIALGDTP